MKRFCRLAILAFLLQAPLLHASAIIVKQAPGRNLAPPKGQFAGRGWQYVGKWGAFLGTPIASHYFVTAKHLGGGVGQKLFFRGRAYTVVESFPCPDSDLAVWRVAEAFPAWAPLYIKDQEMDKEIFLMGRGKARGAPVTTQEGRLCGWLWGNDDHQQSWGVNRVSGIASYTAPGARWKNEMLMFTFDADGGPNEGIVAGNDSGGAVFLQDTDGIWKLAGIIYGVDGTPFSTTEDGKDASGGAFFDTRGLYEKNQQTGQRQYHDPSRSDPQPTKAGATRISSSFPFLQSVIPQFRPFPRNEIIAGVSGASVLAYGLLLRRQARNRKRRRGRSFR